MRWPKRGRRWPMMTTADSVERTRPLLEALVGFAERRTGSRMAAYADVARAIRKSPRWVRRLLGRGAVSVELHDFLNIASVYRRACERIEAEAEQQRLRFLALGREADAVVARAVPAVGLEEGRGPQSQGQAASVVAPMVDEDRQ